MDNRDVRQESDEEIKRELSKEELQETQVLNLQEVKKAIRFEKITSKKPAIFVAVIGILLLVFGTSFQILTVMKANNSKIQKRTTEVPHKKKEYVPTKTLGCTKTTLNNPNNINTTYNIVYSFSEDKLIKVLKKYNVNAVDSKDETKTTIKKILEEYRSLANNREGYTIKIIPSSETAIEIDVDIDYTKLDLTKLNTSQSSKEVTKVDYRFGSTYEEIKKEMLSKGFTVE